jgi:hypothetical protein
MAAKTLTPAQQRERRSKIAAVALTGVLVIVVAIQLPKLLKGHHATTAVTAAPVTPGAAPPQTGVTPAVQTSAPPSGKLTSFTHFALKDPFKSQTLTTTTPSAGTPAPPAPKASQPTSPPASTTPAAPQQAPPVAPSKPKPKAKAKPGPTAQQFEQWLLEPKKVAFKAKPQPPNAALITIDGKQQLVPVGVSFPAASPLFKLVTLNSKQIRIGVLGGSFTSGSPTLAVRPGQKLTLDNEADGSRYVFKVVKLVKATQAQITAATTTPTPATTTTAGAPAAATTAATATTTPAAPAQTGTSAFPQIPGQTG